MKISLNWLRDYLDPGADVAILERRLTMLGIEIEAVHQPGAEISGVTIGRILSIDPHPDADRLVVCKTDIGQGEPLQIVCGATNMAVGDHVPTAVVGATLPGGFAIARRKMRGIESQGMMCSAKELGLGDDHHGLHILPADAPVGSDAVAYLGLDDTVLEIEVTPNRGDWASLLGVARELGAALGQTPRIPGIQIQESNEQASALSSVTIDAPDLCPRYAGRVLRNITVGPSPEWLKQRLIAAGQRPINNIVDITNYVLLETGHPLHAFDLDKLDGQRVVVRQAQLGETIETLDGQSRVLSPDMLVIADASTPIAVAGVMGGAHSEVTGTTVNVFLESAYFNPVSVRRTARALGLITEASQRFQRGADPEMVPYALDRAAQLIQEVAGAEVAEGVLDTYPAPAPRREVTLRFARTGMLLGQDIPATEQRAALEALGFTVCAADGASCTLEVPTWRHDVAMEADLIEEVARLHGYDRISMSLPAVVPAAEVFAPEYDAVCALRTFLTGAGLNEFMTWTFCNDQDLARANLAESHSDTVTLSNPLSDLHAAMRPSLIPALLNNAVTNIRRGNRNVAAFEIGPVYRPGEGDALPYQELRLGIVLTGTAGGRHWSRKPVPVDFYDIKGFAEALLEHFKAPFQGDPADFAPFEPGRCMAIQLEGQPLGHFGEAAASVLRAFDAGQPLYLLDCALEPLIARGTSPAAFTEVPKYPASARDMALLVDRQVPAAALCAAAAEAGGSLLRDVSIFDVYTGHPVPADKKSIALGLVFQAPDRTLTDADTQKAYDRVLRRLAKDFGAHLR